MKVIHKMKEKHFLSLFILFAPLGIVLSISFLMVSFYSHKIQNYLEHVEKSSLNRYIDTKKSQSELWVDNLAQFMDKSQKQVKPTIRNELHQEVSSVYNSAHKIYEKYRTKESSKALKERIKDALSYGVCGENSAQIFLTDFKQNSILKGTQTLGKDGIVNYADADHRVIVLEEIQKVKRHQEGFIESKNSITGQKEIIFVKDLKLFDWFIGTNRTLESQERKVQNKLHDIVTNTSYNSSEFFAIVGQKKELSSSLKTFAQDISHESKWHKVDKIYYYTRYYAPFHWYILYGFDSNAKELQVKKEYTNAENSLEAELTFFLKISLVIAVFVFLISLWFWVRINKFLIPYSL